jgi:hypothetical protein
MNSNLTVVTIVKDDLVGLTRTYLSLKPSESQVSWIVVTPNHPGSTMNFARELLARREIDKIVIDNGSGIYQAMNLALANIPSGQWIWFLNSGDEVASSTTMNSIRSSLVNPSSEWVYGGFYLADGDQEVIGYKSPPQNFLAKNQLFSKSFVSHQSVLMKSEFIKSLNGFNEKFKVAADWDLLVRAVQISKPLRVDYPIAIFHLGGFSTLNRPISNRELLTLRTKYLSIAYLPMSVCWYLYRMARNRIVIVLERFDPKYIKFLRQIKLRFL